MAIPAEQRAKTARSDPRQSGGAGDRPKGVRARLITEFLTALVEDFTRHGKAMIRKARERSPVQYLRLIAALVPVNWFGAEPEPEPVPAMVTGPRHEMVRSPHRLR